MANFGHYGNSFWGHVQGIPDIYVDNFEDKTMKGYFLTHWHSDHYGGLIGKSNPHEMVSNGGTIFMTEKTKIIFSKKFPKDFKIVESLIVVLKAGETYENVLGLGFDVTVIPATHMPGAVMYLLKTEDAHILYSGDFIIENEDMKSIPQLHDDEGQPLEIDIMYLDATFKDNLHMPIRDFSIEKITEEIEAWLTNDERAVTIVTYYEFGYEELLKGIAGRLNKLINIPKSVYDIYCLILDDAKEYFTRHTSQITARKISPRGIEQELKENNLVISVTARNWRKYQPGGTPIIDMEKYKNLCYPTHNSQSMMTAFIKYFKPKKVAPFSIVLKPPRWIVKPIKATNVDDNTERDDKFDEETTKDDPTVTKDQSNKEEIKEVLSSFDITNSKENAKELEKDVAMEPANNESSVSKKFVTVEKKKSDCDDVKYTSASEADISKCIEDKNRDDKLYITKEDRKLEVTKENIKEKGVKQKKNQNSMNVGSKKIITEDIHKVSEKNDKEDKSNESARKEDEVDELVSLAEDLNIN